MNARRIAIVGGTAAGPAAAASARRANADAEITLFEKGDVISYGICELPMYLSGEVKTAPELVQVAPDAFRDKYGVNVRLRSTVEAMDAERLILTVRGADGTRGNERFDAVVLATGTRAVTPEVLDVSAANLWPLRRYADAVQVRRFVESNDVHHAVVIGGGYVGLETAEALHIRGIRVTLLESQGQLMPRSLDRESADLLTRRLRDSGLAVRFEGATGYDQKPNGDIQAVVTDAGEKIGCQLVMLGTGVTPATGLAADSGLALSIHDTVRVNDGMRTSASGIWACGDCVSHVCAATGRRVWVPLALPAYRSGRVAGRNAARLGRGAPARMPTVLPAYGVRVFDTEVGVTGLNRQEALDAGFEPVIVRIEHVTNPTMIDHDRVSVWMMADAQSDRVLGARIVGGRGAALRANTVSLAIRHHLTIDDLYELDHIYTPRLSPMHDPVMIAARRLQHALRQSRISR